MQRRVTEINIYPIKSLGGISVPSASLCATGLEHDRRWMLADTNGKFITQRDIKHLCLFRVSMNTHGFTVTYKDECIEIPFSLETGARKTVTIWDDTIKAIVAPDYINSWFSRHLEQSVSLVYMPDSTERSISRNHIVDDEHVSFADGYPLMIISEASLALLQSKVTEVIPMDRFRPNLVVSGTEAHEEDYWKHFTINDITLRGIKPCKRCVVTTINQQTATANAEPLKTLATYRKVENFILFGQNVAAPVSGYLSVGDQVTIIDHLDHLVL